MIYRRKVKSKNLIKEKKKKLCSNNYSKLAGTIYEMRNGLKRNYRTNSMSVDFIFKILNSIDKISELEG